MNQLSFFEETINQETIKDIRTEKQVNNQVSYDVGEKIGGARKDLAQSRKDFLAKPSVALLQGLEEKDVQTATELVVRSTFFSWFSLEDCRERGVEPKAAKALQLLIARIPKSSKDTPTERSQYMKALMFLADLLGSVYTLSDYKITEARISVMRTLGNYSEQRLLNLIASDEESIRYEDENCVYREQLLKRLMEWNGYLYLLDLTKEFNLAQLEGSFASYFKKPSSRKALLSNALQYESWEELLPPAANETSAGKAKGTRKPVWERALPNEPTRLGGNTIEIETPEHFVQYYGFRSSEFGNYMDDRVSLKHLTRSAEAYSDLAILLNIPTDAVSLSGNLAMAFGSRGRGNSLGHYEPARKVINLTKDRGSLGVLGHEWFHALDHYLFSNSYDFQNGKVGFLSDGEHGPISRQVQDALEHLMDTIKNGESTAKIDVRNVKNTYILNSRFRDAYNFADGKLQEFMDTYIDDFDERAEHHISQYRHYDTVESLRERYARKRVRSIREKAEALAQHHEIFTGERVEFIPYTTNRTNYYQSSINFDKGKIGKYWSSSVEMTARVFESYLYEQLMKRGWTSDYLVCGIHASVYPQGEECKLIHSAMEKFLLAIRPILQKATPNQTN